MDKEGSGYVFIQEKFSRISMEKLKADINDRPQIRELMKDQMFDESERSWTVCLTATEVSSCKPSGKPPECSIWTENIRSTEEFPITWGTNISQIALSVYHCTIFERTVKILVKSWVSTFTKIFVSWKNTTKVSGM